MLPKHSSAVLAWCLVLDEIFFDETVLSGFEPQQLPRLLRRDHITVRRVCQ